MRALLMILFLVCGSLSAAPTIVKAEDADWRDCAQGGQFGKVWDVQIAGCSRVLTRRTTESRHARSIAFYNRGNAYLHIGDYDRAIADYDQVIQLEPNLAKAYVNRGAGYLDKNEPDRAIIDFDQAIRLNPKDSKAHRSRGIAYAEKGDYGRATADFDRAIMLDPKYARAYFSRGTARWRQGDYDRAIVDYDVAVRLNPKDADVLGNRGLVNEERRDFARARADFEAAIAARPGDRVGTAGLDRIAKAEAAASATAGSETRVALVVGNARYAAQSPLDNPGNDAAAVAEALRRAGFTKVRSVEDLSRNALVEALQDFQNDADRADWAVIYFSGHGVEIGGENYLVPVDAQLASDRNAPDEAVSLSRVMDSVHGARKLRMVILDACRNNPFLAGMRRSLAFKSGGKGLAPPSPPPGTLVFYAAKEGEQAQDGKGRNSPFAAALAKSLSERGLELFKMLRYVAVDVQEATRDGQGRPTQHPAFYGDLASREDFYFRP